MWYLLLALAILPGILISIHVYRKDLYEKEPLSFAIRAFMFGILSVFPATIGYFFFGDYFAGPKNLLQTFVYAFGVVAFFEELAKFIFLRLYFFRHREFNEPYDGIVYAVLIGMGFATFENLFYVFEDGGNLSIALMRLVTAVPAHAIFAVAMGYHVGLAKFHPTERGSLLSRGLFYAVILHGAYDFFLMQESIPGLSIVAVIGLWMAVRNVKHILAESQSYSPFKDHPDPRA
jgi:protease PrsW